MLNCVQPTLLREETLPGGSAEPQVTSTPRSEIAVSSVQEDFWGKMKFELPTEGKTENRKSQRRIKAFRGRHK